MSGLAGDLNGLNNSTMIDGGNFVGAKAYKDNMSLTCSQCKSSTNDIMKKATSHLLHCIPAALPPPTCSGNIFLFSDYCFLHSISSSPKLHIFYHCDTHYDTIVIATVIPIVKSSSSV
ncbi:hypothetical protein L6452_42784 [Arctium lappa]|uniref:Uncharacterized protein n=1 Tax=Arctium lappa TaxID=4217 RepID=A0ACB8XIP9_ARCLA|nr:hypothetical protein L6452_42784 [Arctium lappa]